MAGADTSLLLVSAAVIASLIPKGRYDLFMEKYLGLTAQEKSFNNDISLMKKALYVYFNYHKHKKNHLSSVSLLI
jgi:hypothetical protein